MAYIVMAYIVMAYIVMVYIVMAYTGVSAYSCLHTYILLSDKFQAQSRLLGAEFWNSQGLPQVFCVCNTEAKKLWPI